MTDERAAPSRAADPELLVLSRLARLMEGLPDDLARRRVAEYAHARWAGEPAPDRPCHSVRLGGLRD